MNCNKIQLILNKLYDKEYVKEKDITLCINHLKICEKCKKFNEFLNNKKINFSYIPEPNKGLYYNILEKTKKQQGKIEKIILVKKLFPVPIIIIIIAFLVNLYISNNINLSYNNDLLGNSSLLSSNDPIINLLTNYEDEF